MSADAGARSADGLENARTVEQLMAAFNRRDTEAMLALLDRECVYTPMVSSPELSPLPSYHGHDGWREMLADVQARFQELTLEPERIIEAGETVVAVGRRRLRCGDFESHARASWVWSVAGGLVLTGESYADEQTARQVRRAAGCAGRDTSGARP